MATEEMPQPLLNTPYQPGITDPQWPITPPSSIEHDPESCRRYEFERAGRIDPQHFVSVVTADVRVGCAPELAEVLKGLTSFARAQMSRTPDDNHIPIFREMPKSWRVTVTIGLGASIFLSSTGDDRFGLRRHKPRWLRPMPRVHGDEYDPRDRATDLIVLVASDHPYVNVSIARALAQGNWGKVGTKEDRLTVRTLDQGFSRPDRREFLRFDDGIDNLSNLRDHELDRFVYVTADDGEPRSALNGTYLVWRKIRENLPVWEAFAQGAQEGMIGRKKATGEPLARQVTGPNGMTPIYPDPTNAADGPLTAHIRKVQPRRPGVDLFGIADLDRRFLRRGYPFFETEPTTGSASSGLLFMAFMRDLRKQFEWPVLNWQTNPDFPRKGSGIDALYGNKILSNVNGGYYFCPAAPHGTDDFVGSAMF